MLIREKSLAQWWSVIALSRSAPRTGWNTIGLDRHQMDNLAAHHYMVTMIANTIAVYAELELKLKIDRGYVQGMALVHDIGEILLGADMATPQGMNSDFAEAKKAARRLEDRVIDIFADLLDNGPEAQKLRQLCADERNLQCDEARIVKLADRIADHIHIRNVHPSSRFNRDDEAYFDRSLFPLIDTIEQKDLRRFCLKLARALKSAVIHREIEVGPRPKFDALEDPYRGLIHLFNHFQGAKRMPRTGWIVGRFGSHEIDTISEHGYMTSIMCLMLAHALQHDEHSVQIVDMALIEELGKLYGGGVSVLFNIRAPELREDAEIIRRKTIEFLAEKIAFPKLKEHFINTYMQVTTRTDDDARLVLLIGRLADQLHRELVHKPVYIDRDGSNTEKFLNNVLDTFTNEKLKKELISFSEAVMQTIQSGLLRRSVFALLDEKTNN